MKRLFVCAVLMVMVLCSSVFAAETVSVDEYTIEYDEIVEADTDENGYTDRTSYYLEDELVFAAFDEDEDGQADHWFRFQDGLYVDRMIDDTDGDGEPDQVTHMNEDQEVTKVEGRDGSGGGFQLPSAGVWIVLIGVIIGIATILRKKGEGKARGAERHLPSEPSEPSRASEEPAVPQPKPKSEEPPVPQPKSRLSEPEMPESPRPPED